MVKSPSALATGEVANFKGKCLKVLGLTGFLDFLTFHNQTTNRLSFC